MVRPMPTRCLGDHRRVAVVTGAARGIGAATVRALAARGWSVLAVDSIADDPVLSYGLADAEQLSAVTAAASGLVNRVGAVRSFVADVREPSALADAVDCAVDTWGGLDAAVACAGVVAGGVPLWEMPVESERAVVEVCLGGVANLARAAVPALLARPAPRAGRFLALSSAAALDGVARLAAYCAANAGVVGMVRALNAELAGSGVTANVVTPGPTDTALLAQGRRLIGDAVRAGGSVGDGLLDPDEIAAVVAFLAGADSGAIAGAVVEAGGDVTRSRARPRVVGRPA